MGRIKKNTTNVAVVVIRESENETEAYCKFNAIESSKYKYF